MCMYVQCVHGTLGEPRNEAISTAYIFIFDVDVYTVIRTIEN